MPDLANLLNSSSPDLSTSHHCIKPFSSRRRESDSSLLPNSAGDGEGPDYRVCNGNQSLQLSVEKKEETSNGIRVYRRRLGLGARNKISIVNKKLDAYVQTWVSRRIGLGIPKHRCFLPFLSGAPTLHVCRLCDNLIYPGEQTLCSVKSCKTVFHSRCAVTKLGLSSSRKFKCPQHTCFLCKRKPDWHCVKCTLASHKECAPFPEHVIHLKDQPGQAICWRHHIDHQVGKNHTKAQTEIERVFGCLPLPHCEQDFHFDISLKEVTVEKHEPPHYVHIRRNIYLTKKKRPVVDDDIGCMNCTSTGCTVNCECKVQYISCSKACRCSENCNNRPFQKERKVKVVKTENCGWGVNAAESIKKGDFVIEYIGEVIDDAMCEQRLWDMKYAGVKNFYMCEISKDFTIDATFKGNASRFINHSCDPNCSMEKWQADGETRIGVFAAQAIQSGAPLTYDYRFVQFGSEVECHCGASKCQGYLGSKKKVGNGGGSGSGSGSGGNIDICWGLKRKRTSPCISM
ncbi:histone-lysine N-methyltransferase ASHR3 [Impatiens glandulifera]|uniref:histone-lysine N-methyltransferase ASHR3 n=1 Tax=Impatiens glandulifera TaxID=253017 RepID=UPI001FB19AF8|nr:histone-lysine N-methyltransferase ASHR3 [Impatiens glandulifera]